MSGGLGGPFSTRSDTDTGQGASDSARVFRRRAGGGGGGSGGGDGGASGVGVVYGKPLAS